MRSDSHSRGGLGKAPQHLGQGTPARRSPAKAPAVLATPVNRAERRRTRQRRPLVTLPWPPAGQQPLRAWGRGQGLESRPRWGGGGGAGAWAASPCAHRGLGPYRRGRPRRTVPGPGCSRKCRCGGGEGTGQVGTRDLQCRRCPRAAGAAPGGGAHLWLKVWRLMAAEAKNRDLRKLEVWPRHRAKTLDRPRPITCRADAGVRRGLCPPSGLPPPAPPPAGVCLGAQGQQERPAPPVGPTDPVGRERAQEWARGSEGHREPPDCPPSGSGDAGTRPSGPRSTRDAPTAPPRPPTCMNFLTAMVR